MKKLFFTIFFIICGIAPALAQVEITIPDTTVAEGDTILLPVYAEINAADSVYGLRTEFDYDTDHLDLIELETNGTISDSAAAAWNHNAGELVVSFASVNPLTDSGVLMYFRLTPKIEDISELKLINIRVNENDPEAGTESGQINSNIAPETPKNLNFTLSSKNDTAIVDLSWDQVGDSDLQDYIVVRTIEGEDSTSSISFNTKIASLTDSLFDTKTYFYTVQSRDSSGNISERSEPVEVTGVFVSTEDIKELPQNYVLKQNYPNPFNPVTHIAFDVPTPSHVTIEVFSLLGQKVATLTNSRYPAGSYTINFDATGFPSGIYIYRFTSAGYSKARKMLLIK